jgi:WD40 repeat protein
MKLNLLTETERNDNSRSKSPDRFLREKSILLPSSPHSKSRSPLKEKLSFNEKLTTRQHLRGYEKKLFNFLQEEERFSEKNILKSLNYKHPLFINSEKKARSIKEKAFKVLEAPGYKDDYYSHLLDWGKNTEICICINDEIYLHQFVSGKTQKLITNLKNISSIKSSDFSPNILFGQDCGKITLYDPHSEISYSFRDMRQDRITCCEFLDANTVLIGSKDKSISLLDLRVQKSVNNWYLHEQGICGIKINPNMKNLFISGGNDNFVNVFDIRNQKSIWKFRAHRAAVRAMAWDERNKSRFFTGGGIDDHKLKIWNLIDFKLEKEKNTHNQICDILYNSRHDEIITAHGFCSNSINVWKKKSLLKLAEFQGHKQRVLDMAFSPDKNLLVSASSDSSIRFWELQSNNTKTNENNKNEKINVFRSEKKIRKNYQLFKNSFIR